MAHHYSEQELEGLVGLLQRQRVPRLLAVVLVYSAFMTYAPRNTDVAGKLIEKNVPVKAAPDDSGYQRILLAPGIEFHLHPVKIFADVELPVYQNVNGNQLVAPALFKLGVSYMF